MNNLTCEAVHNAAFVVTPINFSDENWENGVARSWSTAFFVINSSDMQNTLSVGKKLKFADESVRTIVNTEVNNGSLIVFLDGVPMDGAAVGYPKKIKIVEEVISKPRIGSEEKAQANEKAQHTCEYVSILKRLTMQLSGLRRSNDAVTVWDNRYKKGGIACTEQNPECDPINYTEHQFLYKHSISKLLTGSPDGDPQSKIALKFLVPPPEKILAIGSGLAFMEEWLVKGGYAKKILAYENSSVAVEKARLRIKAAGFDNNIDLRCGDVLQENLAKGSFDVVFVQAAIHHFSEIEKMFALFHRVLRPGGLLIFDEYIGPDHMQYEPIVQDTIDEINDCLAEKYRWDDLHNETRAHIPRATLAQMLQMDPSEGVHASRILPLTYKWFDVIHRDDYAGAIMRPFWVGILPNFDFSDPKDQTIARLIILIDHLLTRHGIIPNYHTKVVGRRRDNPRPDLTKSEEAGINYSNWLGLRQ